MLKLLLIPFVVAAVLFAPALIIILNLGALAFVIGYPFYKTIASKTRSKQYAH